jgi:hypothetical protein
VDNVNVPPLDVMTVTELPLASGEVAEVEAGPDVEVAELDAPGELSLALMVLRPELCEGATDPEVREELGKWPTKNCILCPVLCGSEHMLVRVFASLNATVADAALVQLQYEPGWRVEGFPSCEQMAHSPSLLSHSVRATHGWSKISESMRPMSFCFRALAHRSPSWGMSRPRNPGRYTQPNMSNSYHNLNREYRSKHCQLGSCLLLHSRSDDQKHRCRRG